MTSSMSPSCYCPHGSPLSQFIAETFSDCIYTYQDMFSFIIGMLGLLCSCVSLFPQFAVNYKLKSVDGISIYLLVLWSFGDLANWAGTVLTGQLMTQTFTGFIFALLDISMLLQYIYYKKIYNHAKNGYSLLSEEEVVVNDTGCSVEENQVMESGYGGSARSPSSSSSSTVLGGMVLPVVQGVKMAVKVATISTTTSKVPAELPICDLQPLVSNEFLVVGYFLAWISGMLYFTSRIPQVLQNYKYKSCEGLSVFLFVLSILGNIGYGMSVLLRLPVLDLQFYLGTLPYLLGSLGTTLWDGLILYQGVIYGT